MKKVSSETILKEELQTFNWNEVDEYPSFSVCDSIPTKQNKKICFEQTLTGIITDFLQKESIVVTQDIHDTIFLNFKVSHTGDLMLLRTEIDSVTSNEIPNIEQLLSESLYSLPRIFPAIKRGQQVNTEFTLPVIVNAN